jgi:hypothetical protein
MLVQALDLAPSPARARGAARAWDPTSVVCIEVSRRGPRWTGGVVPSSTPSVVFVSSKGTARRPRRPRHELTPSLRRRNEDGVKSV